MTYALAIIVGSLRRESNNLKLAKALVRLGEGNFKANILRIDDLPLFSEDLEANVPAPVSRLKQEIEAADAVLFVTPEYNRSVPAPLKNAIDWASRPYGKNSFDSKPAAIIGTSPGAIGTAAAQQHLKPILNYLNLTLMGQPEGYIQFKPDMIDADGNIGNEGTQKFLQTFIDSLGAWTAKNAGKADKKAA